jgi:hypothetical protein
MQKFVYVINDRLKQNALKGCFRQTVENFSPNWDSISISINISLFFQSLWKDEKLWLLLHSFIQKKNLFQDGILPFRLLREADILLFNIWVLSSNVLPIESLD